MKRVIKERMKKKKRVEKKVSRRVLREFPMFVPNSYGSANARATLTAVAAEQSILHLSRLLSYAGATEQISIVGAQDLATTPRQREAAATLEKLFSKHGSDKSSVHDYHHVYGALLDEPQRLETIVEIGIGTNNPSLVSTMGAGGKPGASLRAFAEYASRARIIGADVDKEILFSEGRIETVFVDQTDCASFSGIETLLAGPCDLVIDDGLHAPNANLATLLFALPCLKPDGWCVIEDIAKASLPLWQVVGKILKPMCVAYIVEARDGYLFCCKKR
jgi:cephalosporin hydroxylase